MPRTKKPDLEWCVVGTLTWFGVLKRPLTVPELSRLLLKRKANQRQVKAALDALGDRVVRQGEYYALPGLDVRWPDAESERWFRYKWWRLRLAVRAVRWLPYVRMMAAANTVADRTATRDSDIDVFIVIQHGRLYLTRLLITAVLHLTGLRRHGNKVANRICLSFFVTDAGLNIRSILFEPYDLYAAYWISELHPVLDDGTAHQELLDANDWVAPFVPHYYETRAEPVRPSRLSRIGRAIFDTYLGDWLEQRLSAWQQQRIRTRPPNPDPDVLIVATDRMLKFHEKERRKTYRTEWERRMRRFGYDPKLILD